MSSVTPPNNNLTTAAIILGGLWLFSRSRMAMGGVYRQPGATPVYGAYMNQPTYGQQQPQLYNQLGSVLGQIVNKFVGGGTAPAPGASPMPSPGNPIDPTVVYSGATDYNDVVGYW